MFSSSARCPCKVCGVLVDNKTGIKCGGPCKKWIHYCCLKYDNETIQRIKRGAIKVVCPCPGCRGAEAVQTEPVNCTIKVTPEIKRKLPPKSPVRSTREPPVPLKEPIPQNPTPEKTNNQKHEETPQISENAKEEEEKKPTLTLTKAPKSAPKSIGQSIQKSEPPQPKLASTVKREPIPKSVSETAPEPAPNPKKGKDKHCHKHGRKINLEDSSSSCDSLDSDPCRHRKGNSSIQFAFEQMTRTLSLLARQMAVIATKFVCKK